MTTQQFLLYTGYRLFSSTTPWSQNTTQASAIGTGYAAELPPVTEARLACEGSLGQGVSAHSWSKRVALVTGFRE